MSQITVSYVITVPDEFEEALRVMSAYLPFHKEITERLAEFGVKLPPPGRLVESAEKPRGRPKGPRMRVVPGGPDIAA